MGHVRIGELLQRQGLLDGLQVACALHYQQLHQVPFGRAVVALQYASDHQVLEALARQRGVPAVQLAFRRIPAYILGRLPERLMRLREVLPVEIARTPTGVTLVVACTTPEDLDLLDEVKFAAGMPVTLALASEDDLREALASHLGGHRAELGLVRAIELPPDDGAAMELTDGRVLLA